MSKQEYLLTFINYQHFKDFCITELISLSEILELKNFYIDLKNFKYDIDKQPYIKIYFDNIENVELCKKLIDRAVLIKSILKLYSEGPTLDELIKSIPEHSKIELSKESEKEDTFKFDLDLRGKSEEQNTQLDIIEKFSFLDFKAKCSLRNNDRTFVIMRNGLYDEKNKILNDIYFFFGKEIYGKKDREEKFFSKYTLTKRNYLGPTSTDHMLSFIMTNFAHVKEGYNVIDPFVGTGSLLIPSSVYNCQCFGCDLDIRVLRGYSVGYSKVTPKEGEKKNKIKQKEANIFSNFDQYKLNKPQIMRMDINRPALRQNNEFFDAIICDPPYGWRAGIRKTGLSEIKKEKRDKRINERVKEKIKEKNDKIDINNQINDKNLENMNQLEIKESFSYVDDEDGIKRPFLPTSACNKNLLFDALVKFAINNLKIGGYMVCLFPSKKEEEFECAYPIIFPQNEHFELLHVCENVSSRLKSRWCLVYKKIK